MMFLERMCVHSFLNLKILRPLLFQTLNPEINLSGSTKVQLLTEYGHDTLLIETSSLFLNKEDSCLSTAKFLNNFFLTS